MKKHVFICLIIILSPFINGLFYSFSLDASIPSPSRQKVINANNGSFESYNYFDTGSVLYQKGIYGYFNGKIYMINTKKKYLIYKSDKQSREDLNKELNNYSLNFYTFKVENDLQSNSNEDVIFSFMDHNTGEKVKVKGAFFKK